MALRIGVGVYPTPPLALADAMVDQAEEAGLDSILVPDHLMSWFSQALWADIGNIATTLSSPHVFLDPFPLIARWATRTKRIRFMTAVTDPIRRSPAQIAFTALTMSHVTEGRFVLGIGCGESANCRPYGSPFDHPVARLDEALTVIRRLWSEDRVDFSGRFTTLRAAMCNAVPFGGDHPEIWIGAHGPRMLQLTGRHADGWVPFMPFTPEAYAERLALVREAAERAGRDPAAIVASLNTPVCMADTHEQAHAMLASEAARQFLLVMPQEFFDELGMKHPLGHRHGVTDFVPEWVEERELRAALRHIPDPLVAHDLVIHGTAHEVASQLEAFEDAGLQHFAPLDSSPFTDINQLPGFISRVSELAARQAT